MATQMTRDPPTSVLAFGGAAMIVLALVATAASTVSGIGAVRLEPVVASEFRDLSMVSNSDGSVLVVDVNEPLRKWVIRPSNGDGFVQVALQGLMRARTMTGVDAQQPFRLMRQSDGRLWLQDPSTNQKLTIDAFGPVSARAFDKFFDEGKVRQ